MVGCARDTGPMYLTPWLPNIGRTTQVTSYRCGTYLVRDHELDVARQERRGQKRRGWVIVTMTTPLHARLHPQGILGQYG